MCARICKPILSTFCLIAFNWHADEFEGGWAIWRRGLYSRGQIYGVQRILILFISRFRGRNPHHPQESQRKANKAKGTNSLPFLLTWQTPNRVLGNRHTNFGTKLPLAKCNKKCRNQQVRALDKSGWYDETYVCICTYKRCTYCIYMYVWALDGFLVTHSMMIGHVCKTIFFWALSSERTTRQHTTHKSTIAKHV